jgi:hypothetical protein
MDDQELREHLEREQSDGRISCKTALELAKKAGVAPTKVGRILNDMGVKISSCQLGCFK